MSFVDTVIIILLTIHVLTLTKLLILTTKCECPPYFITHYLTPTVTITLLFPRKLLRLYYSLLDATREIIARICIYTPVPSAVPSANSIVTNDLRVKFRKCRLLPIRYVKSRIVCKRNDLAFAGEFVPLIHPFPLHRTNLG